ncbi:MAG: 2OG-Fe(II) oxygenase [Granulosicoccus sp.]
MSNFNNPVQSITQVLASLEESAAAKEFACKATLPADTLDLSIDGFGNLRLPISKTRAKELARITSPAPFGKGRETLLDSKVRDVGEVKASKVRFDKRVWNRELKPLLETMREQLGLPEGRLSTKLDKLLVYGPGQFFKPHKDTERSDDMIGTLVVILPSKHKGGALIVSHQGETRRFMVREAAKPLLRLFAFYASCEHEVRPVTEGYRVALSFELRFKRVKSSVQTQAPEALMQALQHWFDPYREPTRAYGPREEKLVYLLDHDYTQRSLTWDRLKGVDHDRADALRVASESLNLQAHLALVTVNETWSATVEEPRYYSRRRARPDWYYQDIDDELDESADRKSSSLVAKTHIELDELIDRSAALVHWRNSAGSEVPMPALTAYDNEMCWLSDLESNEPEFEEYEGFMGNYGNTLEREYRRAAVVLWPSTDRYRILAKAAGADGGLLALNELAEQAPTLESTALESAVHSLIGVWPGRERCGDADALAAALLIASHLESSDTATELLRSFSLAALKPGQFDALLNSGEQRGKSFCRELIGYWTDSVSTEDSRALRLSDILKNGGGRAFKIESDRHRLSWLPNLVKFCKAVETSHYKAWAGTPELLFDKLHTVALQSHRVNHKIEARRDRHGKVRQESSELVTLLKAAEEIGKARDIQVLNALEKDMDYYDSEVFVAVLEQLDGKTLAAKSEKKSNELRSRALSIVQSRADNAIRVGGDWSINVTSSCDCGDCKTLVRFLQSRDQAVDLPLAKQRRRHLHDRISYLGVPVTHTTRREGSPYVLQLRKRSILFQQSAEEHKREIVCLKKLH